MTRRFGKLGTHSRGKLNADDEGDLQIGIAHTDSAVIIKFGTPTAWIGLEPDLAEKLAASILDHAKQIRSRAQ